MENFMTREEVEELIKTRLELHLIEIDGKIRAAREGAQGAVLEKLDEIRNELKESQQSQGARIGELEKERVRMEYEVNGFKEHAANTAKVLDRIESKLDKCITTDNLDEKMQKPLQEIKDSITEIRSTPDKKRSEWVDKIIWAIAGIVLAAVGALVLKQIGLT